MLIRIINVTFWLHFLRVSMISFSSGFYKLCYNSHRIFDYQSNFILQRVRRNDVEQNENKKKIFIVFFRRLRILRDVRLWKVKSCRSNSIERIFVSSDYFKVPKIFNYKNRSNQNSVVDTKFSFLTIWIFTKVIFSFFRLVFHRHSFVRSFRCWKRRHVLHISRTSIDR